MLRLMMRTMLRTSCLMALLLAASFAAAQTEFSADIFDLQKSTTQSQAKIYMSKDKLRFESGAAKKGPGGAMIMDLAAQKSTVLMDAQHMYMELPQQMASQRVAYNFFRTGDVEAACSDWANSGSNTGGSCKKIGSDSVNGRSAVKYEGTNKNGDTGYFWIDPKLRFPIKWEGKNGGWELRNIQEGSQPSNLFEIPAGYRKFEMPAGMGGMQQPQ